MSLRPALRCLLTLAMLTSLLSCGGGDGGTTGGTTGGTNQAGGGIGGTGITSGPITAFGSIWVNGREIFLDDNTSVVVNGVSGLTQDDLALGDIVRVVFNTDASTGRDIAVEVAADDAVAGAIESIDVATSTITVLGQTIVVDNLMPTWGSVVWEDDEQGGYNELDLANLSLGNLVEVYGQVDGDGTIHATRIERQATSGAGATVDVKGTVTDLDNVARTFTLGELTVDFSGVTQVDGTLVDGAYVEVIGTQPADGLLAATTVDVKDPNPTSGGEEGLGVEVDGFITYFNSPTDFRVDGAAVTTTEATVFTGGVAANLAEGVKVEVEGHLNSTGITVADEIAFGSGESED